MPAGQEHTGNQSEYCTTGVERPMSGWRVYQLAAAERETLAGEQQEVGRAGDGEQKCHYSW